MKKCKQCNENKSLDRYGKDKALKSGIKNKCKQCERDNRGKGSGKKAKKNINNLKDANIWLNSRFPNYQTLEWKSEPLQKCRILDKKRGVEFLYNFMRFKAKIIEFPDRIFGAAKSEIKSKTKKTMLRKYGVEHALQSGKILNKNKATMVKRYGADNAMKVRLLVEKHQATLLENYGVSNPSFSNQVNEKRRKTMIELYGAEYPLQNSISKERLSKTSLEKYGTPWPSQNEKIKRKGIEAKTKNGSLILYGGKTIKEWALETDFSYSYFQQLVKKYGFDFAISTQKSTSQLEVLISKFLDEEGESYRQDKYLAGYKKYRPDFFIENSNLLIECDGLYWHSDQIIDNSTYHKTKKGYYEDLGYKSLFFRGDELRDKLEIVKSIIRNKLGKSQRVFARKCVVELVEKGEAKLFLADNHLMGPGSGISFGLYYDGELVCIMQTRWKNKKDKLMDISRFCPKLGYSVVGGWSRLISKSIKESSPDKIMNFIDKRYGDGSYLLSLGWKLESNHTSFKWTNGRKTTHRLNYRNNSGYEHGLTKIWDCGQAKYTISLCE